MEPKKKSNTTCSCVVPVIAVVGLAIVGVIVALAINTAQLGICAVPSDKFINPEACVAAIKGARLLYALGGGFFGAFAGFMIGLVSILVFGRSSNRTQPETADSSSS